MSNANVTPQINTARGGLDLAMGNLTDPGVSRSPTWTMGGWQLAFLRLGPGASAAIDQDNGTVYLKVIAGSVVGRNWGAYAAPATVVDTRWNADSVIAGDGGALVSVFTETAAVPANVRTMGELAIQGPHAEVMRWQTFEEKFGPAAVYFKGKPAHMVPGFHLLDSDGDAYAYVHFWTAGKGIDVSTHNHSREPTPLSPAFAEIHQTLNNGTGKGGMYLADGPDAPHRDRCLLQRGEEHGPFFDIDAATRQPVLRPNGAVSYPWHGWESGPDDGTAEAFDLVTAYEITTKYARV